MERSIGLEIRTISNLIKRNIACAATDADENLSEMNGWIIGYLIKNKDKDIFQKDIEQALSVRRSTATNILKLMEKKGLIMRLAADCDGRMKKIILTEKSYEIHEQVLKSIHFMENKMKQDLTKEEIKNFFHVTDVIKSNLKHG